MNRESAISAIRHAFFCGVLSTLLTIVFAASAHLKWSCEVEGMRVSPWLYVDCIILCALTIGLYFRNRLAAIAIGIYFFWSKHGSIPTGDGLSSWIGYTTAITFLYFYLHAARAGMFLLREDQKIADHVKSELNKAQEPTPISVTSAAQETRQP